ncbi:CMRF35-like molecule 8 isoform X2 [Channa argus]|uniref:CMRF35-like molecule 8 isoform X2 n=1 Tax=Channa argus TaxID=215402 RepID=UPI00351FBC36
MMKSFFLLLLSVMAGCDNDVKGCRGGWVEFTCFYPEGQKTYRQIDVVNHTQTITTTVKNKLENQSRIFLYHNTTAKYLKVLIKQLQPEDFGEYRCIFNRDYMSSKKVELEYKFNNCQTPLTEIVTRTDKVTFTCDTSEYHRQNDKRQNKRDKFFCKQNDFFICEDILPTKSSPKSKGRFTVTDTDRGFSVSISDVSSEDAGVYWCGVKSRQGKYRSAFRQIQLQVLTPQTTSTPLIRTSVASDQTTTGPAENLAPPTTSTPLIRTSDQTTTGPAETHGDSQVGVTAAVVCAAVLAVVILLVLFFIRSKTRRNKAEKQKNKEKDHSYAEIQEPPQKTDPGAAMKTVYVPSAFMDYSEITFKNISEEVNGDIYSTVIDNDQHSTYATVHDSKPSL